MGSLSWASGFIPLHRLYLRPLTTFSLLSETGFPHCVSQTSSSLPAYLAVAGPIFSNVRYPNPTFPGGIHNFHGCFYPGVGRPYGGFPNFGYLTRLDHQLHINCLELKVVVWPYATKFQCSGSPGFDRYGIILQ